jgi:hypothetical protein
LEDEKATLATEKEALVEESQAKEDEMMELKSRIEALEIAASAAVTAAMDAATASAAQSSAQYVVSPEFSPPRMPSAHGRGGPGGVDDSPPRWMNNVRAGGGGGGGGERAPGETCVVCLYEAASVVYKECGHLVCCELCARRMTRCPLCRRKSAWMKVFRAGG